MSAGTGARGPRRHASSSAALCTADVATPAVVPRPSSSRSARAPSSPPILASAVTASVWGGPCEVPGTERTSASSLTSASSGCCAAAPRPPSAAAPSRTTTLQADRIRDRLEEGEYMPGNSRHGVLMRQRDQRRLARGEQFAALGLVHRVTEGHTSRGEVAHPAAYAHEVVVPRGRAVAQLHLGDGEVDALPLELLVRQARTELMR